MKKILLLLCALCAMGNVTFAQNVNEVENEYGSVSRRKADYPILSESSSSSSLSEYAPEQGKMDFELDLNFSWLMGRGDYKKSLNDFNYSINGGMGVSYGITDNVKFTATAGYRYDELSGKEEKLKLHYVTVPLMLGYYIPDTKIAIFGGARFNYAVGGKMEIGDGRDKQTIKFSNLKKMNGFNDLSTDLELGLSFNGYAIKYGFSVMETVDECETQYISLGLCF